MPSEPRLSSSHRPDMPCSPGLRGGSAPLPGRSRSTHRTTRSRTPSSLSPGWPISRGCCWTGPATRGSGSRARLTAAGSRCSPRPTTAGSTRSSHRWRGTTWRPRCSPMRRAAARRAASSRSSGLACCSPRVPSGSVRPGRWARLGSRARLGRQPRAAPDPTTAPRRRRSAAGSCRRSAPSTSRLPRWGGRRPRRSRSCCGPARRASRAGSTCPPC